MSTIKVTPIRGAGWLIGGLVSDKVPEAFTMAIESSGPKHWSGKVMDEKHEFVGARVGLVQRHRKWTGQVEVVVEPSGSNPIRSIGTALVSAAPHVGS